MWTLFGVIALTYVGLVLVATLGAGGRSSPWNTTAADRLVWFPAEIALMTVGWLVENAPLVAAGMIPLAPVLLALWVVWALWTS